MKAARSRHYACARRADAVALLILASASAATAAQNYQLSWATLDAGGALDLRGGPYRLSATLGQPDANALGPQTGGAYELEGGFWPGARGGAGGPGDDTLFSDGFE